MQVISSAAVLIHALQKGKKIQIPKLSPAYRLWKRQTNEVNKIKNNNLKRAYRLS